ncbi:MAG: MCP four helix bundle domain-containing protein, partial [Deltaproteobacteria bacterium]|nr:MCP four helix bundle domain-containing protein [Deltaproteobacteria bacterium]
MASIKKIIIGFGIIIVLLAIMGTVSVVTTLRMAATSQRIYAHPFAVTNAAQDINFRLLSIQRDLRNIHLLEDPQQIQPFLERINIHDKQIAEDFVILFDRFLGNPQDVHKLHSTFIEWGL